ncbi:surface antigen-like protein [Lotmaria passim]
MSLFFRRFFLVALLVAVAAVVMANAECDANCDNCFAGLCLACKSGYYPGANGCTSCNSEHCAHCEAFGWCLSCETGYKLEYMNVTDNASKSISVNKYGKCVSAASFAGVPTALVAAAVAVVYAAIA